MQIKNRVSTGHKGFDHVIDHLRLGDNVVFQVDGIEAYERMVIPFVKQALNDNRRLVYIRFGRHKPLVNDPRAYVYSLDAAEGFERFATRVHQCIKDEGLGVFYVFDCLSDLLESWHSDLMIGNFFKVTCPFLFELDTIAFFALMRNTHTYSTIAGIRETTQILADVYMRKDDLYVHPLRVWQRYAPTMFFPHQLKGDRADCITSSAATAELFGQIERGEDRLDQWQELFRARKTHLHASPAEQKKHKRLLLELLVGDNARMLDLCMQYFSIDDLYRMASRIIGSGRIGGKSIGMLLARKIVFASSCLPDQTIEPHDSFYIGADVYYTYIVQNGWWNLRMEQKTPEGFFERAPELREKLRFGTFPEKIREQFMQMLEYFGQSPLIVRSSSLLEDNFGNAFAGKYESVFCVNQGTPHERYEAFSTAVRTVYASTMSSDALAYRMNRGLADCDEQMAILVQRVSGDYHGGDFFPHLAGVGISENLYVWDADMKPEAGMLRLVLGLGTRAVDRTPGDYVKTIALDTPMKSPFSLPEDKHRYAQHEVDVLCLDDNKLMSRTADVVRHKLDKTSSSLIFTLDADLSHLRRETGYKGHANCYVLDFDRLLKKTDFTAQIQRLLFVLKKAYAHPVDIELTANFDDAGDYRINLLQCRPLQTRSIGPPVSFPDKINKDAVFFEGIGHIMGGNISVRPDYIVYVNPQAYLAQSEQGKYQTARTIGEVNARLKEKTFLLIGPGRWGTSTTSLGVPVMFSEICHARILCEVSSPDTKMMPELSFGSHFFQDLVESGIFYIALYDKEETTCYYPDRLDVLPNALDQLIDRTSGQEAVIRVVETPSASFYADIISQRYLFMLS